MSIVKVQTIIGGIPCSIPVRTAAKPTLAEAMGIKPIIVSGK